VSPLTNEPDIWRHRQREIASNDTSEMTLPIWLAGTVLGGLVSLMLFPVLLFWGLGDRLYRLLKSGRRSHVS
jgi:hypothetical protein